MTILIVIILVIAVPFIAALFLSNDFAIERQITINRPRQDVFNFIKMQRNQEQYSKWVMADPGMKKEYKGTDGTVGFVYAWDSKNGQVGKGEQEIKKITEGERIDLEIRFEKPFVGTSYANMTTTSVTGNETSMIWTFSGSRTYIMKVMHFILNLKKALIKDMDTSLNRLKGILEK